MKLKGWFWLFCKHFLISRTLNRLIFQRQHGDRDYSHKFNTISAERVADLEHQVVGVSETVAVWLGFRKKIMVWVKINMIVTQLRLHILLQDVT